MHIHAAEHYHTVLQGREKESTKLVQRRKWKLVNQGRSQSKNKGTYNRNQTADLRTFENMYNFKNRIPVKEIVYGKHFWTFFHGRIRAILYFFKWKPFIIRSVYYTVSNIIAAIVDWKHQFVNFHKNLIFYKNFIINRIEFCNKYNRNFNHAYNLIEW